MVNSESSAPVLHQLQASNAQWSRTPPELGLESVAAENKKELKTAVPWPYNKSVKRVEEGGRGAQGRGGEGRMGEEGRGR